MEIIKSLFKSRTVRMALIQALVGLGVVISTELDIAGVALILKSVGDILLRMNTERKI
jgi:hypothetical protein